MNNAILGLISIRKRRKITQEQLSQMCGVSRVQLVNIENEKQSPTIDTMNKILDSLGCELVVGIKINSDEKMFQKLDKK